MLGCADVCSSPNTLTWGKDRVDRIRECALHLLVAALCDRLCKVGMGLKFAASRVQHTSDFKMTRPSQLHPMHSTRSATLAHTSSPTRCVKHHEPVSAS